MSLNMATSSNEKIKLTADIFSRLKVGRAFRDHNRAGPISDLSFSPCGNKLVSAANQDEIILYDCQDGTQEKIIPSGKYGVDLLKFTHATNGVIHSSTKLNDNIRYLSLQDSKYIRYFPGHTAKVTTLSMCPSNDTFISASLDNTVRLWDIRSQFCKGKMEMQGKPIAAFDCEGLLFAVGIDSKTIKMYDLRSFEGGAFSNLVLPPDADFEWHSLKFSPNGKAILLCSNGGTIKLIDAFDGRPVRTFAGHLNHTGLDIEATFSPDSKFIISGSADGLVHVWDADNGTKVSVLNNAHPGAVLHVQFNPKYVMLATSCTYTAMWQPYYET